MIESDLILATVHYITILHYKPIYTRLSALINALV